MKFKQNLICSLLTLSILFAVTGAGNCSSFKIDYEKYTLGNGLTVVLHRDASDPIVSVAVQYHVGSAREEKGRTGFAHLFEHMLFQESENVGQDLFFKKIQEAGGMLNGGTSFDGTVYYEVVPRNALEMVLWMEADRMGFVKDTVTEESLAGQKAVVKNEKRQRVDNVPYGHTNYVIHKLLYPQGHPYNWDVIGSFEDLERAALTDVHKFHEKWYGPNNATLVVAGDFDRTETGKWIEKYFGDIKGGLPVEDPAPMPAPLTSSARAYVEDGFAASPELNMVFPTVEQYSRDSYALALFSELLAEGKKAPLYRVIVEEEKKAPSVSAFQNSLETAGYFRIRIRCFPDQDLTAVEKAVHRAFERFENEGFTAEDLARVKAGIEVGFYHGISSVLGKSFQLARYNEYAGSPAFISEDIENYLRVTEEDIRRVYHRYIKGKNAVLTSFVPRGKAPLAAEGSRRFPIGEETRATAEKPGRVPSKRFPITEAPLSGSKSKVSIPSATLHPNVPNAPENPSSFDRSVEPAKGPVPATPIPRVWTHTYENGLKIYGIEQNELPLVNFSLSLKGGLLLDDMEKVGTAGLVSELMIEGTKLKSPAELEEAIDGLGSHIRIHATKESIVIRAGTLASNVAGTYDLFEEILLQPRWDEKEFLRIRKQTMETIRRRNTDPDALASNLFNRLLYGDRHILSHETIGTLASVGKIRVEDLKSYYRDNFAPNVSHIAVAGNITKEEAVRLFSPLEKRWPAKAVSFPEYPEPEIKRKPRLYFVDQPDAEQSQIRMGHLALPYTDPDFHAARVMNHNLGGSFNSIVNSILREEKGYTYGASTDFSGSLFVGPFTASTAVRSDATAESLGILKNEISKYRGGISEEELANTRNALVLANTRRFETLSALTRMLDTMAKYDLPVDYLKEKEKMIRNMTVASHRALAQKYIRPEQMVYLVVGDAKTRLTGLDTLGLGKPILLDKNGKPVKD